jgi:tetratricopeptide (TPR) repeat protein
MRSAGLIAVLCLGAAGCSWLRPASPPPAGVNAGASGAAVAKADANAPAPAAAAPAQEKGAATTTPAAPLDAGPVVSPATQRAFDAARQALEAGRREDAERGFLALTRSNPELGGPHANLGLIYRQAGRLPEAAAALERAVHANPQQPVYLNQLGITYRLLGQFQKAREAYEQAIVESPDYPAAYLNLGILFDLYLWDSKRAVELYDRYLALSPAGDDKVRKWVADIRNRKPQQSVVGLAGQPMEQP